MKLGEKYTGKNAKAKAMAAAVGAAIEEFAGQNGEFREAVEQGGSFTECMDSIAAAAGSSISDLEAYRKAAEFFFKGARVVMQLRIELEGDAPKDKSEGGIILNLEDWL